MKSKTKWDIIISSVAITLALLTLVFWQLYRHYGGIALKSAMAFFLIFCYEIVIRFLNGQVVNLLFHNRIDYRLRWFRSYDFETKFFKTIRIKQWKNKMPTYDDRLYSLKEKNLEEIMMACCQSEIFHESNMLFGFSALFLTNALGVSSGIAIFWAIGIACLDFSLAAIQRFNRPRLKRALEIMQKKKS